MKIYYHSNCPDGIMAREIFQHYLKHNVECIPANYPFKPTAEPDAIFIDISPDDESIFGSCLAAGAVIGDHHESKRKYFEKFFPTFLNKKQLYWGETDKGISGARLAIKILEDKFGIEVSSYHHYLAEVVGVGDCFIKSSPLFHKARALASYIHLFGNEFNLNKLDFELAENLYEKELKTNKKKAASLPIFNLNGIRTVIHISESNSNLADAIKENGANVIIFLSYYFKDSKDLVITLSIRGDGSFNCMEFAKEFNGGGHINAAGGHYEAGEITSPFAIPLWLMHVAQDCEARIRRKSQINN